MAPISPRQHLVQALIHGDRQVVNEIITRLAGELDHTTFVRVMLDLLARYQEEFARLLSPRASTTESHWGSLHARQSAVNYLHQVRTILRQGQVDEFTRLFDVVTDESRAAYTDMYNSNSGFDSDLARLNLQLEAVRRFMQGDLTAEVELKSWAREGLHPEIRDLMNDLIGKSSASAELWAERVDGLEEILAMNEKRIRMRENQ